MGLRRPGNTKDYEEMNGSNVPTNGELSQPNSETTIPHRQEFELTSVSVVPDGQFIGILMYFSMFLNLFHIFFRYFHRYASSKCIRFRMVPSEIVVECWSMLDGRFNGDDNFKCFRTRLTLCLGNNKVPASTDNNHCIFGNDAQFHILGSA